MDNRNDKYITNNNGIVTIGAVVVIFMCLLLLFLRRHRKGKGHNRCYCSLSLLICSLYS